MVYAKGSRFCGVCIEEYEVDDSKTPVYSSEMIYTLFGAWTCNKCIKKLFKKYKIRGDVQQMGLLLTDLISLISHRHSRRTRSIIRRDCIKKIIDSGRNLKGW